MGFGLSFSNLVKNVGESIGFDGHDKIGNTVGQWMNNFSGTSSQMDKSYQQQLSAMERQNAYNTQMWNMQNEYNSPTAQLARMREAGIDVNPTSYALGTGNLSNTATFVGSENGFSGSGSPAGNPISMALGVANGIADVRQKQQYTKNLKEQEINIMTEGNRLLNSVESQRLENEIKRHNLQYAEKHGVPVNTGSSLWENAGRLASGIITQITK